MGLVVVLLLLLMAVVLINLFPSWQFGDDTFLFLQYMPQRTIRIPSMIPGIDGRYYPLGHTDYNILMFVPYGNTAVAHYVYLSLLFLLSVWFQWRLFKIITNTHNSKYSSFFAGVLLFELVGTWSLQMFVDVIYPEKTLIVFLPALMLLHYRIMQTNKSKYVFLSILIVLWLVFCKEPVFSIFVVLSCMQLLFTWSLLTQKQKVYMFSMLLIGIGYVIIYVINLSEVETSYNESVPGGSSMFANLLQIVIGSPFLFLLIAMVVMRGYAFFFRHDREHISSDSFLFASFGYFACYVVLKMNKAYYFTPCYVLMLPTLYEWGIKLLKNNKKVFCCFSILFVFAVIVNLMSPQNSVKKIKETILCKRDYSKLIANALPAVENNQIGVLNLNVENLTAHERAVFWWNNGIMRISLMYESDSILKSSEFINDITKSENRNYIFVNEMFRKRYSTQELKYLNNNFSLVEQIHIEGSQTNIVGLYRRNNLLQIPDTVVAKRVPYYTLSQKYNSIISQNTGRNK
jgi:hypothetical protein